jgi:hypothetical protein
MKKQIIKLTPPQLLVSIFGGGIIIGALLLMMPVSTTEPIRWVDALFTSTSAMTVTGHFLVHKPGYKTIASQVYDPTDPHLETDSQFGVTRALIGNYARTGEDAYSLEFTFVIEPGDSARPRAPITGKVAA